MFGIGARRHSYILAPGRCVLGPMTLGREFSKDIGWDGEVGSTGAANCPLWPKPRSATQAIHPHAIRVRGVSWMGISGHGLDYVDSLIRSLSLRYSLVAPL